MAYKRKNHEFNQKLCIIADAKKTRTVTMTIDDEGNAVFLKGAGDVFCEMGAVTTQRASHVEPDNFLLRALFHCVRHIVRDDSATAAWTRLWPCLWRVNAAPVGGVILPGRWTDRQSAIDAEIEYLNQHFLRS